MTQALKLKNTSIAFDDRLLKATEKEIARLKVSIGQIHTYGTGVVLCLMYVSFSPQSFLG